MIRSIPFIVYPQLNVQGDISYPAWLVTGLVFADPGYPKVTNLVWGTNIIGRWIDEFSEVAEQTLDIEHFKIELEETEEGEMKGILTDLGSAEGTTINLGGVGNYLELKQGDQYLLLDETMIEAGGRYLVFKVNPSWRKWARSKINQ